LINDIKLLQIGRQNKNCGSIRKINTAKHILISPSSCLVEFLAPSRLWSKSWEF